MKQMMMYNNLEVIDELDERFITECSSTNATSRKILAKSTHKSINKADHETDLANLENSKTNKSDICVTNKRPNKGSVKKLAKIFPSHSLLLKKADFRSTFYCMQSNSQDLLGQTSQLDYEKPSEELQKSMLKEISSNEHSRKQSMSLDNRGSSEKLFKATVNQLKVRMSDYHDNGPNLMNFTLHGGIREKAFNAGSRPKVISQFTPCITKKKAKFIEDAANLKPRFHLRPMDCSLKQTIDKCVLKNPRANSCLSPTKYRRGRRYVQPSLQDRYQFLVETNQVGVHRDSSSILSDCKLAKTSSLKSIPKKGLN